MSSGQFWRQFSWAPLAFLISGSDDGAQDYFHEERFLFAGTLA